MNVRRTACFALLLGIPACSSGDDGGATGGTPEPATSSTTTTTTPLALVTEGPPTKPGIEARVKAEVDGKTEGIAGTGLTVPGTRGSLQTPTGWTTAKGAVTVVTSADKKAQLAAGPFTAGATGAALAAAATALGLTGCEWNPEESMLIGKNALPGNGADGRCTRGTATVKTAYVAPTAEGLLVMGAWEDGGDSASIFGSMRSIIKVAGGVGGDAISACCAALAQNANSAPPDQKAGLLQAAAICNGLRNHPQGKAALVQIQGVLRGAKMPSSCR